MDEITTPEIETAEAVRITHNADGTGYLTIKTFDAVRTVLLGSSQLRGLSLQALAPRSEQPCRCGCGLPTPS